MKSPENERNPGIFVKKDKTMTHSLINKARANRRAALATLNARIGRSQNVVSIFDRAIQRRQTVPEFRTSRAHDVLAAAALPVLVLRDPLAA